MRATLIAAILLSGAAAPVIAQSGAASTVNLRVDKLEKEMKAVQRKVFPNGVALEPEISGSTAPLGGTGSDAPVADLTARVDALESQLKSLTGQVEQNGFRIKKTEDANKALEARIKSLESAMATQAASQPSTDSQALQVAPAPTPKLPVVAPKPVLATPAKPLVTKPAANALTKPATPAATPLKPLATDPKRAAAIKAAVQIPSSDDPIEDAYSYAFRLWQAKFYPEAQAQFKDFVAKHPDHRRYSYAQNLLGRAYLDDGKPGLASVAFFENYQKKPKGERASESLYWLGQSLTRLKKLPDACKVYQEFTDVYGGTAPADLKAKVAKGRVEAKCSA